MVIEAARRLAEKHDLKPADIETISIFGVGVNSGITGVPWSDSENPHVLAQFCAPYEVASVIKNRRLGPDEITNDRIADDKVVDALARRGKLCLWKEWGGPRPAGHAIRVKLRSGEMLEASCEHDEIIHPDVHSHEQLVRKFESNAAFSGFVHERQADEMVQAIDNLDKCEKIREFISRYLTPNKRLFSIPSQEGQDP